jgi:Uncharacterised protein family (UPF0236)
MKKKTPLSTLDAFSEEQLAAELARRRASRFETDVTLAEDELELSSQRDQQLAFQTYLDSHSNSEDDSPKPCPLCKQLIRVKASLRRREVRTVSGQFILRRNYHYCTKCKHGFYPLDLKLSLLPEGELTPKMELRVLDFALTSVFTEAAERWSVHYQSPISASLVRQVAERVGKIAEVAEPKALQEALQAPKPESELLVVETDGSMLSTRDGWKEVKLGVVYRKENHVASTETDRGVITEARYVAVLGEQKEFKEELKALLEAEKAESAPKVAWLGDGAKGNWTLADSLCPDAIQVLDFTHAVENGNKFAKALWGEGSDCLPLWEERLKELLMRGDVNALVGEVFGCITETPRKNMKELNDIIGYYRNNEERMNYPEYIKMGLPIGSGAVESGHKHVLQKRMKLSGQHWERECGSRMAKLRAGYKTCGGTRKLHQVLRAPTLAMRSS